MAHSGRILLALAAAAWLLAGLAPVGLQICRQADGTVELGLGCPCDTCNSGNAPATCCSPAGCLLHHPDPGLSPVHTCCTCSELSILPAVDLTRDCQQPRVDVLLADLDPQTFIATAVSWRAAGFGYQANAPPDAWDPASIRLLI